MNENEQESLSPTKRALLAVKKLQGQVDALTYQRTEPIAIIGMGCRFPGGVNSPAQFWELLYRGGDAITEVPPDRWDVDAYYDADPNCKGKIYNRYGGFISDVDQFDPSFFGISPREAEMLDPQQRLWLEVCWEALERAGIPPLSLRNSQTAIFASSEHLDYLQLAVASGQDLSLYTGTGNMHSVTSGRLAHFLGTQGPAVTVDTACSASLVAIHLACQALRTGDCTLALAGGVNLILSPTISTMASQGRVFAPDGRCKTFSAAADGYTRSDGCGVVVLKRLSDAQRDGDVILALIRGSAINHDGHSSGLTVPNGASQQKLIRQALANAGVTPDEISYVEAHGTGTVLGDPIEIEALGAVFGQRQHPLWIGSVKTNIGHAEAAAGVAGLMKVVLAMQQGQLPPQVHFDAPNPHIPWEELPFVIPTTPIAWQMEKRLAGVSAFSLSGTNAHVILESPPTPQASIQPDNEVPPYQLITLSARSKTALDALVKRYIDDFTNLLAQPPAMQPTLANLAYTTQVARSHFEHRLSIIASSLKQAHQTLSDLDRGQALGGVYQGTPALDPPKIAFLFPGQGAQYVNMGRQLYLTQPVFRQTMERCDQILQRYLGCAILPLIYPDLTTPTATLNNATLNNQTTRLYETQYAQPALFSICYALTQLWATWGIQPDLLIGHSTGEYIAACVAGVFSLEDSLRLVVERSRLMHSLPAGGEMVAVMASESEMMLFLQDHPGVTIAAVNGPQSVVLSGLQQDVQRALTALHARSLKTKVLSIPLAAHSPMMEPILDRLEQVVQSVDRHLPRVPVVSSPFGTVVNGALTDPTYWRRHLRQPVRFADGIQTLHKQGCNTFIEISPKPVLLNTAQQCVPNTGIWVSSLREGQDDWQQLLSNLGILHAHGVAIDWYKLHATTPRQKVDLPTYPFQRRRYWLGNGIASQPAKGPRTALIDSLEQGNAQELIQLVQREGRFTATEMPFLQKAIDVLIRQQQAQSSDLRNRVQESEESRPPQPELYQLLWKPQPRQNNDLPLLSTGVWLILADRSGVGRTLAEMLREHNQTCCLVYAGEGYQRDGENWIVNPSTPHQFVQICQEVNALGSIQAVIHLWSIDTADPDGFELDAFELEAAQQLTLGALLHLTQALLHHGCQPRIWCITSHAVAITDRNIAVLQSPLWGLGRSVSLEMPHLWGGLLDLDHPLLGATEEACYLAASTILTEIWDAQGETQLAYRAGVRYAARLAAAPMSSPTMPVAIQAEGTYLITGGLGALGLHVARWLVSHGAKQLVLLGRSGLTAKNRSATDAIAQLTAAGCAVQIMQADVAEQADVARVLATIADSLPPLRGIVHTAGIVEDGILLQQQWSCFQRVLAPKVTGSWHLYSQVYSQTAHLPLDFLLFFSSAAALLGSAGQGNYAAANAFMDALAQKGQLTGRNTFSIGWGSWAGEGLAAQRTGRGEDLIDPAVGLQRLQELMAHNWQAARCGQMGIMAIDWDEFTRDLAQVPSYLSDMTFSAPHRTERPVVDDQLPVLLSKQISEALPDDRQPLLTTFLKSEVARVLGAYELPEAYQRFFDIGMDSLMALQLSNRLQSELGIKFPTTLVFEYPSVDLLARYLLQEVFTFAEREGVLPPAVPNLVRTVPPFNPNGERSAIKQEIKQMSSDELTALIDREFADLLGGVR